MEAAHHPRQPRKLHWLPNREARQHREHSQPNRGGVRVLLQRVVGFLGLGFVAEEKVVPHYRPYTRDVTSYEEHLLVVSAEDLIAEVHEAGRDIDPHEGKVPLQRAAQPSTERKGFGPVEEIFLRDLGPKTRESTKDLESAAHHHDQGNRVYP